MTSQLILTKISENKLLYTVQPFKWVATFSADKAITVITPMTTIGSLLKLKGGSELFKELTNVGEGALRFLGVAEIEKAAAGINDRFKVPLLEFDRSGEKIIKSIFDLDEELLVTKTFLEAYFLFLDAHTSKRQIILVAGFDDLAFGDFKMLTVHLLFTTFTRVIHWGNLQQVVMLDFADLGEIVDREKFKSWLELKTRTVLSIEHINEYFRGSQTMNSFLIDGALKTLQ